MPLPDFAEAQAAIVAIGKRFDARGWAPATAGNYSCRLADGTIAITVSGARKGQLSDDDVMRVDPAGTALDGRKPSAETALHLQLYAASPNIGCVLHSHSPGAVALSRVLGGSWTISGHELLKVLPNIETHDTAVVIPIVGNSQDIAAIAAAIAPSLLAVTPPPAYLIRGHGLYGWGRDTNEAECVIEAIEWLVQAEIAERLLRLGERDESNRGLRGG